ncbi:CoA transferase [Phenylobacterium sp.]|jgi:crotonobetainyl-CoA:carnitine CoA-transferase CaiB-like acyl-CoA transferase|uniref:CaiB/BaiF CoA transferase family protein n=1 Tax=Phenylobacterium sp. TaxID=1871053 RepID=UPI002F426A6A
MPGKSRELAREATGPLKGIRIVDMTSVVFGAYATQMLADLGADVIKVESPPGGPGGGGDIMRQSGRTPEGAPRELGPIYMTINRNKRSVLLDLRLEKDAAALRRLLRTADVFAATVRYDGLARLGLDYGSVRALKPDVVYVHGAGYGSDGPYAGEPAYDDLIQAAAGMGDLLPRTDGDPEPRLLPSLMADKISGHFMAQAILAALLHKQRSGEGQFVEVPMYECVTSFNLAEHFCGHVYDPPTGPWGYGRVTNPYRKPFATKDGHIGLLPYTDEQWGRYFKAVGAEETHGRDPRFAGYLARSENTRALYKLMEEITATRTTAEWVALLKPLHIPVVAAKRLDELPDDPHLAAVDFFQRYEHPAAGAYYALRPPVRYLGTPANIRRHAPMMGEHTEEVLSETGED